MFFIYSIVNYQAFIENKQLISIKELKIEITSFEELTNCINGTINLIGEVFINSLDETMIIDETLNFNIEKDDYDLDLIEVENFIYQIVEGRGLEIELDFKIKYNDQERKSIKEEIVNQIEEKLDKTFNLSEDFLETDEIENVKYRNFSKTRRSYRYCENLSNTMSNDNGQIIIKRN